MNEIEVGKLLTFVSGLDNRKLSREVVLAWHKLLGDVDFADAMTAATEHYRASRDWLMPADLVNGAARVASRRRRQGLADEWLREAIEADPELNVRDWWARLSRAHDVSQVVRDYARSKAEGMALEIDA